MSRKYLAIVTVVLALLALAVAIPAGAQETQEPVTTTATVHRFSDNSEVENAHSQLTRFANGVTSTISTQDLNPGDTYTIWWVIFNEPQNCNDGICDAADIFQVVDGQIPRDEVGNRVMNMDGIGAANIAVIHASGSYSTDGALSVSASLGLDDVPGIVFGPGLLDPQTAEVHLVVRTHGAKVDNLFDAQISTFGGGCEPIDAAPCDDVQYAIHLPVSG